MPPFPDQSLSQSSFVSKEEDLEVRISKARAALAQIEQPGIDGLNERVQKIVALADLVGAEKAKVEPTALAAVKAGAVVYKRRSRLMVLTYIVVCSVWLFHAPSLAYAIGAILISMISMDMYGAVLHVVLDAPEFIWLPAIGEGALEFQWHHSIPRDIVSKDFMEVVGDLNWVCFLHLALHLYQFGWEMKSTPANALLAAKLMTAYLGQWSHRMAHEMDSRRPAWVRAGQSVGLLLAPETHSMHHRTYDDGFPILNGITLPLIRFLRAIMPDNRIWLGLFVLLSFTDTYVLTHCLTKALGLPIYP